MAINCQICKNKIKEDDVAFYDYDDHQVVHVSCLKGDKLKAVKRMMRNLEKYDHYKLQEYKKQLLYGR